MTISHILKFELVSAIAAITSYAVWWGSNPLDPWGAELLVFGALIFGIAVLLFIVRLLFDGVTALLLNWFLISLSAVIAWELGSLRNQVIPQMLTYEVTEDIPVSLRLYRKGKSNSVYATVTNESQDWLRSAVVRCYLFMHNGKPIDRRVSYAIANGYMGEGESHEGRVVADYDLEKVRADASRTKCEIETGKFMERPEFPTRVEAVYDPLEWRHVFVVENLGDKPVQGIQLQCQSGWRNVKVPIAGRWELDVREPITVPAFGRAEFIETGNSYHELSKCVVISAAST